MSLETLKLDLNTIKKEFEALIIRAQTLKAQKDKSSSITKEAAEELKQIQLDLNLQLQKLVGTTKAIASEPPSTLKTQLSDECLKLKETIYSIKKILVSVAPSKPSQGGSFSKPATVQSTDQTANTLHVPTQTFRS